MVSVSAIAAIIRVKERRCKSVAPKPIETAFPPLV
jgi:hypothetical protein